MPFVTKVWKDRLVEFAGRRKLKNVTTGEEMTVDVSRMEGAVSQSGDAFSAATMNDLEQRVKNEFDSVNQSLNTVLIYNEKTDYFGMVYNGIWKNVLFAGLQADYIYKDGNVNMELTGGLNDNNYTHTTYKKVSPTFGVEYISLNLVTSATSFSMVGTNNIIDLSKYTRVKTIVMIPNIGEPTEIALNINDVTSGYIVVDSNFSNGATRVQLSVCSNKTHYNDNRIKVNTIDAKNSLATIIKRIWLE